MRKGGTRQTWAKKPRFFFFFFKQPKESEGFPSGSAIKNPPAVQETQETRVRSLGQEDALEEGMATHSSIFAWTIPWTEEPGGLQLMNGVARSQSRLND